ncbi:MAG: helix-turn-helix domain-containing protein [Candidatus Phocaeicola faecigallinarum]|uniref:Helix-turn-helix domain-containing protein n=1 Tax=Candidatus Phocaeicola faecigallinarum TaxID=2838732 RepID=A0A948T9T8_9BACT|nr:helix-turn-helix domain-containing protein [Candidatus Phocaeicola faecigallinarum]
MDLGSVSDVIFRSYSLELGTTKDIIVNKNTLIFFLKGNARIVLNTKCIYSYQGKNGIFFACKKDDKLSIFVIGTVVEILIVEFKSPLIVFGYQPILNIMEDREKSKIEIVSSNKSFFIIKDLLNDFLRFVFSSLQQNVMCRYFSQFNSATLFFLLKSLYDKDELYCIYYPFYDNIGTDFKHFVNMNYKKFYKVKELAEFGNYSLSKFKRKFNLEFGEPPGKWINDKRKKDLLNDLMNSKIQVNELISLYKFSSIDYFYKYCKRELNLSLRDVKLLINK